MASTPAEVAAIQKKVAAKQALSDHENHVLHMWNTGQWSAYLKEQSGASAPVGTIIQDPQPKQVVTPKPGTAPPSQPPQKVPAEVQAVLDLQKAGTALSAHQAHVLHMWNTGQWDAYVTGAAGGTAKPKEEDPGVAQARRDATVILTDLFTSYGLASLVPRITDFIKQGYSADAISILLSQTPEYKQRFAANDTRTAKGLPALSPAEYIATERSYRQIMTAAGLPTGFYDQTQDFTNLISADVSATELQDRVTAATDAINKAPSETLNYFKQWYSTGDLVAFALDPNKAAPVVEKNLRAAEAAALASHQRFGITQGQAEHVASKGLSLDQMQHGMSFVGSELPTTTKLSQIYGGPSVTTDDLLGEIYDEDANAAAKRQKLASQERATFAGRSGANGATVQRTETVL